jgi:uncharacterized spore protein YtfJ
MDNVQDLTTASRAPGEPSFRAIDRLFAVARPESVFSQPVTAHDQTLITASEVRVGMGFGFGSGEGTSDQSQPEQEQRGRGQGRGAGGGGGGRTMARPVAIISVSPAGVRISPIIDVSRLALTALTTLGTVMLLRAVRRRG